MIGFLKLFRINRTVMVAAIAGTGAYASGASPGRSMLMVLGGFLLAVGGFSMDFVADRDLDRTGPRAIHRLNPVASGEISPRFGLVFSIVFLAASLVLIAWLSPLSLIPWAIVIAVIVGLAVHHFETALTRSFTLGVLQALYFIMGALEGSVTLGIVLLALMFFFAMFGGRALTDIRDFLQDSNTPVETFPKKYGIRGAVVFTSVCLIVAYFLSFAAWLTGEFNGMYLVLDLVFIVAGLAVVVLLWFRPTPKIGRAHV
jgi:4-hydroxybenzoate polyprenyltransferase